jgi:hypothetical protein
MENKSKLLLLFSLLFLYSSSETLTLIFLEDSIFTFLITLFFLIAIFILQTTIIFFLKKNYYLISFFSAFNFVSLKLIFIVSFATLGYELQIILFILLITIFIISFKNYKINKLFRFTANLSLIFLIFSSIILNLINYQLPLKNTIGNPFSQIIDKTNNYFQIVKKIKFISKPDIYILSFDSVAQDIFYKKYFNLTNIPYSKTIKSNEGRVFKNTFSSDYPTKKSINNFLMLDLIKLPENTKLNKFSGQSNSLLYEILDNNKYIISSGYSGDYLGKSKGPFVDYYFKNNNNNIFNSNICLLEYAFYAYFIPKFLGICEIKKLLLKKQNYQLSGSQEIIDGNFEEWQEMSVNKILQYSRDLDNQHYVHFHMYRPIGHTDTRHRPTKKLINKYLNETYIPQSKKMQKIIEKIILELKKSNKDYIMLIISDHGPFLSSYPNEYTDKIYTDEKFKTQDTNGTFIASIKTKNICSQNFEPFYTYKENSKYKHTNDKNIFTDKQSFTTLGRAMTGLIYCLSNNDSKSLIKSISDFTTTNNFEKFIINE